MWFWGVLGCFEEVLKSFANNLGFRGKFRVKQIFRVQKKTEDPTKIGVQHFCLGPQHFWDRTTFWVQENVGSRFFFLHWKNSLSPLRHFGTFWDVLRHLRRFGRFWEFLEYFGTFWDVLGSFGHFWEFLGRYGTF